MRVSNRDTVLPRAIQVFITSFMERTKNVNLKISLLNVHWVLCPTCSCLGRAKPNDFTAPYTTQELNIPHLCVQKIHLLLCLLLEYSYLDDLQERLIIVYLIHFVQLSINSLILKLFIGRMPSKVMHWWLYYLCYQRC